MMNSLYLISAGVAGASFLLGYVFGRSTRFEQLSDAYKNHIDAANSVSAAQAREIEAAKRVIASQNHLFDCSKREKEAFELVVAAQTSRIDSLESTIRVLGGLEPKVAEAKPKQGAS